MVEQSTAWSFRVQVFLDELSELQETRDRVLNRTANVIAFFINFLYRLCDSYWPFQLGLVVDASCKARGLPRRGLKGVLSNQVDRDKKRSERRGFVTDLGKRAFFGNVLKGILWLWSIPYHLNNFFFS